MNSQLRFKISHKQTGAQLAFLFADNETAAANQLCAERGYTYLRPHVLTVEKMPLSVTDPFGHTSTIG